MPVTGAVADRIHALIPITWDALLNDPRVGDGTLQTAIDVAKENTTGQIIDPSQEENYPVVAVDYMAKLAIIEICTAAVDYWMNQATNVSATGTNENESYIDRAQAISGVRQRYIEETRRKLPQISKLIGYWIDDGRAVPQMSSANIQPFHLTPSPEEFPRPYRQTQYS
jgi:hypothetical protein